MGALQVFGQAHPPELHVRDDWLDRRVLHRLAEMLVDVDPSRLFFDLDLGSQDTIVGCVTCAEFCKLQELVPDVRRL